MTENSVIATPGCPCLHSDSPSHGTLPRPGTLTRLIIHLQVLLLVATEWFGGAVDCSCPPLSTQLSSTRASQARGNWATHEDQCIDVSYLRANKNGPNVASVSKPLTPGPLLPTSHQNSINQCFVPPELSQTFLLTPLPSTSGPTQTQ